MIIIIFVSFEVAYFVDLFIAGNFFHRLHFKNGMSDCIERLHIIALLYFLRKQ